MDVVIRGMEIMMGAMVSARSVMRDAIHGVELGESQPDPAGGVGAMFEPATNRKEKSPMTYNAEAKQDRELQDDLLKLVRYRVLFVKREYEHAFDSSQELVADNLDGTAFAGWKIAEFIQGLRDKKVRVPASWGSYPDSKYRDNGHLVGLPPEDQKYLRVYFEVEERYPREKFLFEEEQVEALREIARNTRRGEGGDGPPPPGNKAIGKAAGQ